MGFSILWDLAILIGFASLALCARSRSASLGFALALFGLVCVDLISQLSASALDRMVLDAAYPYLYPVMLLKNFAFLGLAIYAIVRAVEFPKAADFEAEPGRLAHNHYLG